MPMHFPDARGYSFGGLGIVARSFLFTFLLLAALTGVIYPLVLVYADNVAVDQAGDELTFRMQRMGHEMEQLIDAKRELLHAQARALSLSPRLDGPALPEMINNFQSATDGFIWVGVADRDGRLLYGSNDWLSGESVQLKKWFVKGLNGDFVSDLLPLSGGRPTDSRLLDSHALEISMPIRDGKQTTLGVLAVLSGWSGSRRS
ncbi:MAG: cache domain-containing protein [Candidatus Protistobacter heckmanni]|nr:cache domain-containing protein [Candidatus Protistobacter heckmanni]